MKRWLSPWVLPLVMLGCVLLITRPVAGVIWIVASVVLVRLLNGFLELPSEDELLRRHLDDPRRSFSGASLDRYFKTPS
ncbi:MAG: hypothetical protein WAK93_00970 [Solirubrobacteraceae bacterium]